MKKLNNVLLKLSTSVALNVASRNVNSCCVSLFHQPKVPQKALKLKK